MKKMKYKLTQFVLLLLEFSFQQELYNVTSMPMSTPLIERQLMVVSENLHSWISIFLSPCSPHSIAAHNGFVLLTPIVCNY